MRYKFKALSIMDLAIVLCITAVMLTYILRVGSYMIQQYKAYSDVAQITVLLTNTETQDIKNIIGSPRFQFSGCQVSLEVDTLNLAMSNLSYHQAIHSYLSKAVASFNKILDPLKPREKADDNLTIKIVPAI